LKQSVRARKFESKEPRAIGGKQMSQSGLLELTWGYKRCVAVIGGDKREQMTVAFAAVRALAIGNSKQLNRPDPYVCFFEMKVTDLAAGKTIRLYNLLQLLEIFSAFVGRPLVRLVAVTGGLANTAAEKCNPEQAGTKCRCQDVFKR
jgi:hypothetical protein